MAREKFAGPPEDERLTQPYLLQPEEAEKTQETALDNCLVLTTPVYSDAGKRREWSCFLHVQPPIFQPDTDMEVIASATDEIAVQSQRKRLKPGDRVVLTGIMGADTLTFTTRERKTIHRLALTQAPQLVAKAKRVSTTDYEQRRNRR